MGMVRLGIDGNVVTFEGPGIEPIADAPSDFDPRAVVLHFLRSIDAQEMDRLVLERLDYGGKGPVATTLDVLMELAGAG